MALWNLGKWRRRKSKEGEVIFVPFLIYLRVVFGVPYCTVLEYGTALVEIGALSSWFWFWFWS